MEDEFCPSTINISLGSWEYCLYCGEPAVCQDHVIPVKSYFLKRNNKAGSAPVKVKSCFECNTALGAKWVDSILERIELAQNAIFKKNRKILLIPAWEDCELEELRPTIRSKVESLEFARRKAKARIEWAQSKEGVEALASIQKEIKESFISRHFLRRFFCC